MSVSPESSRPELGEEHVTGHEGVDAVVATMAGLDDLPVGEHVAVFERAHESLRRALSDAGQG